VLVDLERVSWSSQAAGRQGFEGRARAQRQLHSAFQAQPAGADLRECLVEVGDPV
jgi:hypothetical protein